MRRRPVEREDRMGRSDLEYEHNGEFVLISVVGNGLTSHLFLKRSGNALLLLSTW